MPCDLTDDEMIYLLKDCTAASIALSDWFNSQYISPTKAVFVVSILLTSLAETTGLSDKEIDKVLRHIRIITRAVHDARPGRKPGRRKRK
jgi:hypothetical protein